MKTIIKIRKGTAKINLIIYLLFVVIVTGCSKDDGPEPAAVIESTPIEEVKLSDAKEITSFVFLLTNNPIEVNVVATIDEENKTITAAMPPGTNITGLLPEVQLSELAAIDLTAAQDFTETLEYMVTAEDGTTSVYTVTITALFTQRQILQAILDDNPGNILDWDLENTVDLGNLSGVTTDVEGNVIQLHIDGRRLSQLSVEIGQLTNLTSLNLSGNQLSDLLPEIGQLTNLEILRIAENQLSDLPPEIGQLTNLERLDLEFNKLSSLPFEITQLVNLKRLEINENQLADLPSEIGELTSLVLLSLSSNNLSSLPTEITQLVNLRTLDLRNNNLSEFNHVPFIPSGGNTNFLDCSMATNLEVLQLSGNPDLEVLNQCLCNLDLDTGGTVHIDVVPNGVRCVNNNVIGN